jgi:hypothetical protein
MNGNVIERNCRDCPLVAEAMRTQRSRARRRALDPENAPERQLEQLERSFGPNWKW